MPYIPIPDEYLYPGLWDFTELWTHLNTWYQKYDAPRVYGNGTMPIYHECLWSLQHAYQKYQRDTDIQHKKETVEQWISKERTKKGYATKRYAPPGYIAITKPLARTAYEQGYHVTLCGNNVNSSHIFKGWHLGYTIHKHDENKQTYEHGEWRDYDFQELVDSYMCHNESSLCKYPSFYISLDNYYIIMNH